MTEPHGSVVEIGILVGHSGDDEAAADVQTEFQPPELLHIHVVSQRFERHGTAHHVHRGLADKAGGEHQCMNAQFLKFLCHLEAFLFVHTGMETIVHVGFHYDSHVILGLLHHAGDDAAHEAHAVFKGAAIFVAAVVGVGRQELADEVTVAGVHLDAVEAGTAAEIDGFTKIIDNLVDVLDGHLAGESGRVEIETTRGRQWFFTASGAVGHIAAVSDLDGSLCALRMDGICQLLQFRHNLLAQPELAVE